MANFILQVRADRTVRGLPTYVPFEGTIEKAKDRAEELLAPVGIAEVEVFQRIEDGRLTKRITTTWAS